MVNSNTQQRGEAGGREKGENIKEGVRKVDGGRRRREKSCLLLILPVKEQSKVQ